MATQSSVTGAAGEHHVLSELLRRNWISSFAPKNSRDIDILAMSENGEKYFSVQVKTKCSGDWQLNSKVEEMVSEHMFYAFVDLGKDNSSPPVTYILPSSIVATCTKKCHQAWLRGLPHKGKSRNDNNHRKLATDHSYINPQSDEDIELVSNYLEGWLDKYCESWDTLKQDYQ